VNNPVIFKGKIVFSDSGDQICDYCNFVTTGLSGSGRHPKRLNK
jgi:hypothetical protein